MTLPEQSLVHIIEGRVFLRLFNYEFEVLVCEPATAESTGALLWRQFERLLAHMGTVESHEHAGHYAALLADLLDVPEATLDRARASREQQWQQ